MHHSRAFPTPPTFRDPLERGRSSVGGPSAAAEDFHHGVFDREEKSSTALGNGVAIPHSLGLDALTSSIAVYVPREPIEWGEERVSLVARIAFSKDTREHSDELFESLIRVLSKRPNVERLAAHGGSYEEFIATLLEII